MNRKHQIRSETTFRDVYRAVSRHRKKAVFVFMMVMVATVLVTVMTPKAYLSESKLFVRLGRENSMLDPAATLGNESVVTVPNSREDEINSVAEMLRSRVVLEQVVDQLGPEAILEGEPNASAEAGSQSAGAVVWVERSGQQLRKWASAAKDSLRNALSPSHLTPRDQAIERVKKRLEIEPVRRSNVVSVAYEAPQAELARRVVSTLVDAYLEQHVRLNRTSGTHEFFAEHTERLGGELSRLEGELRDLKTTTGLASVDQQRQQIVTRMGRLEDEVLTAEALRSEAEAKVDALRARLAELPKEQVIETNAGVGNHGTDMIRDRFFSLQVEEKEAAAMYTADHPKLKMIRQELAEAERILAEQEPTRTEVKTAPDQTYEQTRLALNVEEPLLVALKAKTELLQSQFADVRESLETLNANEVRIAELKREIELHEADYRKYAMNLEEARIDHAMETQRMSNISVVQPASLEPRAIRPRKALNLALGLIVAVCGAFSITILSEYVDRTLHTPDEIERNLELPTLASIPRMSREALKVKGSR